jgi:hypothetical protein
MQDWATCMVITHFMGAAGILGMPNGPFLYADQLLDVLTAKSEQGGFKDLVIYVVCSFVVPASFSA